MGGGGIQQLNGAIENGPDVRATQIRNIESSIRYTRSDAYMGQTLGQGEPGLGPHPAGLRTAGHRALAASPHGGQRSPWKLPSLRGAAVFLPHPPPHPSPTLRGPAVVQGNILLAAANLPD